MRQTSELEQRVEQIVDAGRDLVDGLERPVRFHTGQIAAHQDAFGDAFAPEVLHDLKDGFHRDELGAVQGQRPRGGFLEDQRKSYRRRLGRVSITFGYQKIKSQIGKAVAQGAGIRERNVAATDRRLHLLLRRRDWN